MENSLKNCLQRKKRANKLFAHIEKRKKSLQVNEIRQHQLRFNNNALTDIPRVFTPKALGWETLGMCHNLHVGYKY